MARLCCEPGGAETLVGTLGERKRVRFELISVVSHELKAPLAAVEGFLHVLAEDDADPDTRQGMYARCTAASMACASSSVTCWI